MIFETILLISGMLPEVSSTLLPLHRRAEPKLPPLKITNTAHAPQFDVEVKLGNQTFYLLADTGSSDLWVVHNGYTCYNPSNQTIEIPQENCTFGATYDLSPTFSPVANETFGVHYGAGNALGILGLEDVTLGSITVKSHTIGVADRIAIQGSGTDSGILGLGYPWLTSAHPGTSIANDTISLLTNKVPYDPLLLRMASQGSIEPWFSITLERLPRGQASSPGGYLGLGALPSTDVVNITGPFVVAPVEITKALPLELTGGTEAITEWTLSVDGVTWGSTNGTASNTTSFQAVVDNGNYFNQLPQELSDAVHAAYDPPAVLDEESGFYIVDCNVVPPTFGLTIGGTTFYHRPEDLVLELPDGTCVSTIMPPAGASPGGDGAIVLNFLGDVFMHNVVSVFDFGRNEMKFAARNDGGGASGGNYSTTPSPTASPTPKPSAPVTSGATNGVSAKYSLTGVFILASMLFAVL